MTALQIKNNKINFFTVGTIVVLISLIAVIIVLVFSMISQTRPTDQLEKRSDNQNNVLGPSAVLNNKPFYDKQKLILNGKVVAESVVCQGSTCPPFRNLILVDSKAVLTDKNPGQMRILNADKQPLCVQKSDSRQYDCGDWQIGSIYQVEGEFHAEPPPPSWQLSLDYYFLVQNKQLVGKTSTGDIFSNLIQEIKNAISKFKSSTYYVLP